MKDEPVSDKRKAKNNDYIDSVNVFGGSHQAVYSKNFKGGEITAVFGGCDVNLTQADFEGEIKIEVTAIFGGAKIIIPPGWEVKSEVTAIFGGLDDKRAIQPLADDAPRKVLIIEGLALFGGVDIRNY
ncbi:Cell wall-active antibiotics response 4TMS YvqF [compost metagenome]